MSATVELGPLLTLSAALIAATIAYGSYLHRRKQDRKEEWWRRTQWALDRAPSAHPLVASIGLDVLTLQGESKLTDEEDLRIIKSFGAQFLDYLQEEVSEAAAREVKYDEGAG